jgi:hypothetical protein
MTGRGIKLRLLMSFSCGTHGARASQAHYFVVSRPSAKCRKTRLRQLLLSIRQEASGLVKHGIDLVTVFHLELKQFFCICKICDPTMDSLHYCDMQHKITSRYSITHLVWGLLATEPTAVKQECNGIHINGLTVAVGVHQLLQLGGSLDAEKHLVAVL